MAREKPTEVTERDRFWLNWSGVHSYDKHHRVHGILRPDETTTAHLPPTDDEAVRRLDKEALESATLGGKWNAFLEESDADAVWERVTELVDENAFFRAKIATKFGKEDRNRRKYALVVYTPNYFDQGDVFRVRDRLREVCREDTPLYYKPAIYTSKGIYADNASEFGLDGASRYDG